MSLMEGAKFSEQINAAPKAAISDLVKGMYNIRDYNQQQLDQHTQKKLEMAMHVFTIDPQGSVELFNNDPDLQKALGGAKIAYQGKKDNYELFQATEPNGTVTQYSFDKQSGKITPLVGSGAALSKPGTPQPNKLYTLNPGQVLVNPSIPTVGPEGPQNNVVSTNPKPEESPKPSKFRVVNGVLGYVDPATNSWKAVDNAPPKISAKKQISDMTENQLYGVRNALLNNLTELQKNILNPNNEEIANTIEYLNMINSRLKEIAEKNTVFSPIPSNQVPGVPGSSQDVGPKMLDEATARQILQEAGGDPERAKQIAIQRGY